MPTRRLPQQLFILLAVLTLTACNLPASVATPAVDSAATSTSVAQTLVAQLTQVAQTLIPTLPTTLAPGETQPPPSQQVTPTTLPSPTLTPTDTPAATNTPTSSPTPPATTTPATPSSDPRKVLGNPDFYDSFFSSGNWPLYTDEHVSFNVKNDQLVMVAFNPDYWEGWMITWPTISNVYLEMTATTKSCSGGDRYGMLARAIEGKHGYEGYFYGITCDGRYSLRIWDGEKFVTLVDWTSSKFINTGSNATNRIGLMMDGDRLTMYANGNRLGETRDDTYSSGKFGVFIGAVKTTDFKVFVDEIAYWELP